MPRFRNNPGEIWRGMPSRGMGTTTILKSIGCNEADIDELIGKDLARVEEQTRRADPSMVSAHA